MIARALATVGGLGDLLPAPGTTVGSLVGLGLFLAMTRLATGMSVILGLAGLAVLAAVSVWACGAEAARRGVADPQPVVLDEVAGQWLALVVVTNLTGRPDPGLWVGVVSFLLFRAFDIAKPWPIRALERLPGGGGIVVDDLAAGLAAGALQAGAWLLLR
jgi:phosphatidylglycerophosphatase A